MTHQAPVTPPNDNDGFFSLVAEHKGILYKIANGYCRNRDDRGDLIQEIVIQLWQSFPRYEESRSRFSTWMYRIAVNVAISAHRSANRRVRETVPIEDFGLELAAADKVMDEATDDVRLLRRLIGELDELSRALVILYLDGYAHAEIAQIVGISATNASTRIHRIKEKLQREFDAAQERERGAPHEAR
jgi:RNA polymerase sigma-70 factor (ECF subfamily)